MTQNQSQRRIPWRRWLLLTLSGLLIGGGAILPGISGGVLCVIFGIYRPMMELLSHPKRAIPLYWRMFIPVLIGWVVGFLFFAKAIEFIFNRDETLATWLFIGLIAGTIPTLWRDAGGHGGHPKKGVFACVAAFILLFGGLLAVRLSRFSQVEPNFGWYVFSGMLWGLSLIIPGMSSSPVLMALGLFEPLAAGIAGFDWAVLIPWGLGMAATALLLARAINRVFRLYDTVAYHAVVGVVAASTLIIIPTAYRGLGEILLSLACCVAGVAGALLMDRLGSKAEAEEPAL